MYQNREVFASAPLEFVAAEVRFPFAPRLAKDEAFELFTEAFRNVLPVPKREQAPPSIELGPAGARPLEAHNVFRFLNRDRTASATVTPTTLTVETTDYGEYPEFRRLLETVFATVSEVGAIVGLERVGLRYVDELRVPVDVDEPRKWAGYVSDAVLAPLDIAEGYEPISIEGLIRLVTGNETGVLARYATLIGSGVVGGGPLKRRSSAPEGPFFVVDVDSYWQTDAIEDFTTQATLELFDRLHEPVGELFLRVITERFKNEVARQPR